jgi:hypothetical protein
MDYVDTVHHIFCLKINGIWHRTAQVFNDATFDAQMDKLEWRLPYNMKVFHFASYANPPMPTNPVLLSHPLIEINLDELFANRIGVRLKRPGVQDVAVLRYSGDYAITETRDGYCRLLNITGSEGELLFEDYFPIPILAARRFVDKHHRHCVGPRNHKFSIGLLQAGILVGVLIASTPKAKAQNDGFTLELNRCCVLPDQRNACSKLYGKAILAGRSMGYRRFITYTLPHESGSSLKAVNFRLDGLTQAKKNGWDHPSRPRKKPERYPEGQKCRWILTV